MQKLEEFVGLEQVYVFVRLARPQLEALRAATDCIYEVELAPPPLRDLKLLEDVTTKDVRALFSRRRALTHPPSWFSIPESRASYAEVEGG